MRRLLATIAIALSVGGLVAAEAIAGPRLPARMGSLLIAPVEDALAKEITAAQDGDRTAFTIAVDGGKAEPLAVSGERLRDFRNVYYRISGEPGSWRLHEQAFSPTGDDEESRQIRKALGVADDQATFFLPGREHLVLPAKSRAVLRVGSRSWVFRIPGPGSQGPTRGVLVRAGQPIPLALEEALTTATARPGASVALTVSEDVVVDGLVAVLKGTPVRGRVVRVHRPSALGGPGHLELDLGKLEAVDGSRVPLCGEAGRRVRIEGRPGFLLFPGKHVSLPAGTALPARAAASVPVLAPVGAP